MNGPVKNLKELSEFPGYYITLKGDIWSGPKKGVHKCGMFLKPQINKHGQLMVCLYKNRVCHPRLISRLMLETFIGPCPEGLATYLMTIS